MSCFGSSSEKHPVGQGRRGGDVPRLIGRGSALVGYLLVTSDGVEAVQ